MSLGDNPQEFFKYVNEYKDEKEAFVSGLIGGSIGEINLVTAVGPASILLWSALQSRLRLFDQYNVLTAAIDFMLIPGSILYSTTALADNAAVLLALLLAPAVLLLLVQPPRSPASETVRKPPKVDSTSTSLDTLPVKPFITSYRGWMMLITCSSILAVDFQVFPRRFAKVETWGSSLMDLGVGSFVFSTGVVAARPVLKKAGVKGLGARLFTAMRHSLPLFALGIIRLISVKSVDYAEHVTEYGVHWNFFFTLAFIPPFAALFDWLFQLIPSYSLFALIIAVVYQVVLDSTELVSYITVAPRVDLLSRNREGIVSLFGYLAIFLAGQGAGTFVLKRYEKVKNPLKHPLLLKLGQWSALWAMLFFLSTDYRFGAGVSISRRMANLPYVLWTAAYNTIQITLLCAMELYVFPGIYNGPDNATERRKGAEACSRVLQAFNRNGLVIFLVANLLTGAVNMTLPTIKMGNLEAMGVLIAYMGILTAFAVGLDVKGISIKL